MQIAYAGEINDRFLETLYQMPRRLILSSEGGDVYTLGAAVDLLLGVGDVAIIGTGCIFSAAVPILTCGKTRFCTANTRFMVHEAYEDGVSGGARKLIREVRELRRASLLYLDTLAHRTKKSRAFWARLMRNEVYFGAKEALKWGVVDEVL